MKLWRTTCSTPMGTLIAWRTDKGLACAGFEDQEDRLLNALERRFGGFEEAPDRDPEVKNRVRQYFNGDLNALNELPADAEGTALQKKIWRSLRRVPAGKTISYGELAAQLKTSPRVIGNAMGSNPLCLTVPCHRVIGKDGSLTGYAYGTDRKRWLLDHETQHAS